MNSANFLLGCAVWSYKEWVGEFFPPKSRSQDFLSLYGQRFKTVEGNTTFYATPDAETVQKWALETPEEFEFCLKLPRAITHQGLLTVNSPEAIKFWQQMQPLGKHLGPIFAQLPPHYSPQQQSDLIDFLTAWKQETQAPLAVELRHPDWYLEANYQPFNEVLKTLEMGRVILDTRAAYTDSGSGIEYPSCRKPLLPVIPSVTTDYAFVRYVSHPEMAVNEPFWQEWSQTVAQWLQQGIRVYFFMHCPVEARSPHHAKRFQEILESANIPVPKLPWNQLPSSPIQLSLF